jgi:hypothetical protein
MDCNDARFLLPFLHTPDELPAPDRALLEAHLASCPECRESVARERAFDESVSLAMNDVEVPSALRGQIDDRLAEGFRQVRRRRLTRSSFLAATAAACVLLGISFSLGWWTPRSTIVPEQMAGDEDNNIQLVANRNLDAAQEFFLRRGLRTELPNYFDYGLLSNLEIVNVRGHSVARLDFQKGQDQVKILVLPRKYFSLPHQASTNATGSLCTIEIVEASRDFYFEIVWYGNAKREDFILKTLVG